MFRAEYEREKTFFLERQVTQRESTFTITLTRNVLSLNNLLEGLATEFENSCTHDASKKIPSKSRMKSSLMLSKCLHIYV